MTPDNVVRVAIVERDAFLSALLGHIVRREPDMAVATVTTTVALARTLVSPWATDVVVLDVDPPNQSGLEWLRTLQAEHPHLQSVLLTSGEPTDIAIRAAAGGRRPMRVISKRDVTAALALIDAIRASVVMRADPRAAEEPLPELSPLASLTARQLEALHLLAVGLSNAAIAETLGISVHSVENLLNSLYAALSVRSDPDLNPRVAAVLLLRNQSRGEPPPGRGADRLPG